VEVTAETKEYYGYFENQHAEQWILVYDFDTETGILRGGDAGWQNMYAFINGRAPGMTLNHEERAWLIACWLVVNTNREHRDEQRQADGTNLKDRPRTTWETTTADGRPIILSHQAGRRYLDGTLLVAFHPQREETAARVDTEDQAFCISDDDFARLMEV
jgi:hypothetical protein